MNQSPRAYRPNSIICSVTVLCLCLAHKADNCGMIRLHCAQVYNKQCLAETENIYQCSANELFLLSSNQLDLFQVRLNVLNTFNRDFEITCVEITQEKSRKIPSGLQSLHRYYFGHLRKTGKLVGGRYTETQSMPKVILSILQRLLQTICVTRCIVFPLESSPYSF